jgi:chromosome segregation ATPase
VIDQDAEHEDGPATGDSETDAALRDIDEVEGHAAAAQVGGAGTAEDPSADGDAGGDSTAPYGRCLHCDDPLPAPLRRGGRRLEHCPAPKKCRSRHNNARRSASRSDAASVLRSHDQVAARTAPALADVGRLLIEHAARHQALLDELGEREELENQIDALTDRNAAVEADAGRRIRQAAQHADQRIAEVEAQAARDVAAAEQRAHIALTRADDADERATEAQRLADQRVAEHDLARGRAEEQAAAATRDTEQARHAQADAEEALRGAAEELRAAEQQISRLSAALQTATDERDAQQRRAEQAEQRATADAETLQQTKSALADIRRRLIDAEAAHEAALSQATAASTRAEELRTRADNAEQRADREVRRADQATTRADQAADRADRFAAETDRLRTALHLPPVGDVDGVPGVRAGGATVTAASGLLHLAGVHQRLDSDAAGELARAMLALAAHVQSRSNAARRST